MQFMNTEIDNVTFKEAVKHCCNLASGMTNGHYVVTPNVDHIVRLENDDELADAYRSADLILADGKPLLWIAKLYGKPILEKISGSDLFPALCEVAAEQGLTMFFFGAGPGIADRAAINLTRRFPGLKIIGTASPDYGFENDPLKVADAIRQINSADPDILIVGLGCPKQEKFIYRNRSRIKARLLLGLGASLDFEAGKVKRAPRWMSSCGLEWLYRMFQDPKRLVKRYLVDDIRILPLAIKYWGKS